MYTPVYDDVKEGDHVSQHHQHEINSDFKPRLVITSGGFFDIKKLPFCIVATRGVK